MFNWKKNVYFQIKCNIYIQTLTILYLIYVVYDRDAGDVGGRGAG